MTKAEIEKQLKAIRATITQHMTNEDWSDDKGNHYYINRAPIDWKKVFEGREK